MLQLQSFAKLLNENPSFREEKETKLVLIGSARNEGDEKRIQSLRLAAKELNIEVATQPCQGRSAYIHLISIYYRTMLSSRSMLRSANFWIGWVEQRSAYTLCGMSTLVLG